MVHHFDISMLFKFKMQAKTAGNSKKEGEMAVPSFKP